jgi:iron(III) transport system substrate-binding protein
MRLALIAMLVVPSLAAPPPPSYSPAEAALYSRARAEGGLDWYAIPLPYNKSVVREFEARYPGVKVRAFYAGGVQLAQRFRLEKESGRELADCVSSGLTEAFPDFRERGWLEPLDGLPSWSKRPSWSKDPKGSYFYYANFRVVLMWNADLVPDKEAPRSVSELAEPRWRRRVVLFDPSSAGVAVPLYRWVVRELGLGARWLSAMRANEALFAVNAAQMDEAVASGRRAVALTRDTEALGAIARGAPISWRVPREGTMLHMMPIAINAAAPHPHSARLFVEFLLSDAGRKSLAGEGVGIPIDGERTFREAKAWALDAESVTAEDSRSFLELLLRELKG